MKYYVLKKSKLTEDHWTVDQAFEKARDAHERYVNILKDGQYFVNVVRMEKAPSENDLTKL